MKESPISAMLRSVIEDSKKMEIPLEMSREEQKTYLSGFRNQVDSQLQEGDFVQLNEYGQDEYKFPKGDDIALVTKVLPSFVLNEGRFHNGQIMVTWRHQHDEKEPHVHHQFYAVDLRFFKKVKE